MSEEKKSKELDLKPIYNWNGVVTRHATNIVIQHTKEEFILSFFEVKAPIILNPEEDIPKLKKIGTIDAECISRVVITPSKMEEFLEVMNNNFEHFKEKGDR